VYVVKHCVYVVKRKLLAGIFHMFNIVTTKTVGLQFRTVLLSVVCARSLVIQPQLTRVGDVHVNATCHLIRKPATPATAMHAYLLVILRFRVVRYNVSWQ